MMPKAKCVYTDKAGNKLYVRYIKSRDAYQWTAKNRKGKIVMSGDVRKIIIDALKTNAAKWKSLGKHEMVERLENIVRKLPRVKKTPMKSGHNLQSIY